MRYLLPTLLLSVFMFCLGHTGADGSASAMTEQEEIEIGKEANKQILQQYRVYNNQNLLKYVNFIGQKLAEKSSRPDLKYTFTVLDSDEVNAFALPGGYIYITRGIMAYLRSEAELAAVLGHEVGHVAAHHAARQESASKVADFGSKLAAILGALYVPGLNPNVSSDLLGIGSNALLKGYGRDHELEADQLGAEYMAQCGYDTQAMIDVLTTLKGQESYEYKRARFEDRQPHIYHGLFADHPSNDTRLTKIIDNAGKFKTDEPVYIGNDTYLNLINGLSYGPDPSRGIIIGPNFYHGPLGYAVSFPDGWKIDNKSSVTIARHKTDAAIIQISYLRADRNLSPRDFMMKRMGLKGLRNEQNLTINGLPAHSAQVLVNSPYGQRLSRVTVIYFGSRAIILSSATKDVGGINRFDNVFLDTARSFRPLTRQERMAAGQQRIRVIRADENTTYQSLAAHSPLHYLVEEQLRLLNGDYPTGEIKPGELIKIVQ